MQKRRGFISMSVLAILAVVALVALAVIFRNCRKILNPRVPYLVTVGPYEVVSVDTGASLTVRTGRRRTKVVILEGIESPALADWMGDSSRQNLEKLAGGTVTIDYYKRGLFRSTAEDNPHASLLDGEAVVQPETEGIGKVQQEEEGTEARGPFDDWMDSHKLACNQCRISMDENPNVGICTLAFAKMQEILRQGMVEIDCYVCDGTGKVKYPADPTLSRPERLDDCYRCSGTGKWWSSQPEDIEARGPLIGVVHGASGIDLNL